MVYISPERWKAQHWMRSSPNLIYPCFYFSVYFSDLTSMFRSLVYPAVTAHYGVGWELFPQMILVHWLIYSMPERACSIMWIMSSGTALFAITMLIQKPYSPIQYTGRLVVYCSTLNIDCSLPKSFSISLDLYVFLIC